MNATKKYTAINVEHEARDAVRRLAAHLSGQLMRRVTLSEALVIAERMVRDGARGE